MDIRSHRQYSVDTPIPIDQQQQQNADGPPSHLHPTNGHPLGMPPPIPVDAHSYYSNATMVVPHPHHPDCPNSLNCLPDTNEKPNHILPVIVRSAILGSPKQKLTIREIYKAIENKFPYFRTTEVNWKDSIRHNLSLNKLFEKVPRPLTDPGIGSYWTVNVTARGAKRPRKRKGRPIKDGPEDGSVVMPNEQHQHHSPDPSGPMPPPPAAHHFDPSLGYPGHPVPGAHHFMQGPPSHGMPPGFGDDTESELGDTSLIDPSLDPSLSGSPDDHGMGRNEPPKATIARLRQELSQAKRQFTLATQQTSKLAEQLADVEEDAKNSHAELESLEAKLEEETLLRVEFERKCHEAQEAQRAAEAKLKAVTTAPLSDNDAGEERAVRNEIEVVTDGDVEVGTMVVHR
ncbi:hypothetical protein JB92DRAFT_3110189 [Gautieria morchelliformis]|nr:hypothetical protein JB92DRAFT_3110189 [Gautieria morchelliformis]